eukprot:CAMPEP_0170214142 /NCGR_PEP_ID=MMETSP0116_2-20130129/6698_1 /TAXON_ID=400756 /ORGANISM="Durinskia baltica, Strain CSIRO CS-38" /LENGTH=442 /DNA_ID=CAMNT_0010464699 /DNA_START=12 /DNA_END=1335 /DNA_ORIENTATION=+
MAEEHDDGSPQDVVVNVDESSPRGSPRRSPRDGVKVSPRLRASLSAFVGQFAAMKNAPDDEFLEHSDEEDNIPAPKEACFWRLEFDELLEAVQALEVPPPQDEFLQIFLKTVADPLLREGELPRQESEICLRGGGQPGAVLRPGQAHRISVSADLRRFEIRVAVPQSDLVEIDTFMLAFLQETGMPESQIELCKRRFENVLRPTRVQQATNMESRASLDSYLSASMTSKMQGPPSENTSMVWETGPTTTALWCRLDRIGGRNPHVDFGCYLDWNDEHVPMDWGALDLLLPSCDDKDALIDYAMSEQSSISGRGYSFSLMPNEPESTLHLKLAPGRAMPLDGLLFFKSLNFSQPREDIFQAADYCATPEINVDVSFGPLGLTRVSLKLFGIEQKVVGDLCRKMRIKYQSQRIKAFQEALKSEKQHCVEFAVTNDRYMVAVGFR